MIKSESTQTETTEQMTGREYYDLIRAQLDPSLFVSPTCELCGRELWGDYFHDIEGACFPDTGADLLGSD